MPSDPCTRRAPTCDHERERSAGSRPRSNRRGTRWAQSRRIAIGSAVVLGIVACTPVREDASGDTTAAESTATSGATLAASAPTVASMDTLTVTVYKTPTCGCCRGWVDHLRTQGFRVETVDGDDLTMVKAANRVPGELESCHTATVGGYVVEGHVPAGDMRRLLAEHPPVVGIAVPGMPVGSPGMEMPGTPPDRYDVVSFDRSGATNVFASQ